MMKVVAFSGWRAPCSPKTEVMMRFVGSLGIFAVTTALLVPTAAFADEAPPPLPAPPAESTPATSATSTTTIDAVHLRNGGLYRGHVTEIVPVLV